MNARLSLAGLHSALAGPLDLTVGAGKSLLMFLLSGGSGLAAVAAVLLAARRLTDARQRLRLDRLVR